MHFHEYRLHPDWVARVEMFRQFASRFDEPDANQPDPQSSPPSATSRWPLPKLTYRHRSTFSPRPR